MNPPCYRGRFAPSPTGPLHFGTLVAATGSYLQARSQQGEWLMRIEDVDTTRSVTGADRSLLSALETLGFEWDGTETYQSRRTELYQQALVALSERNLVYPCTCSRKQLSQQGNASQGNAIYPGSCRKKHLPLSEEYALRVRIENRVIHFNDRVMGHYQQDLATECGDFVIKRRDQLFAYQLAVVVDDALQGITEVVRGADLLDSTPRQIYLQHLLNYPQPAYLHLPLAVDHHQHKLSKSAGDSALDISDPVSALLASLRHLGQQPPDALGQSSLTDCWEWALHHWDVVKIPQRNQLATASLQPAESH